MWSRLWSLQFWSTYAKMYIHQVKTIKLIWIEKINSIESFSRGVRILIAGFAWKSNKKKMRRQINVCYFLSHFSVCFRHFPFLRKNNWNNVKDTSERQQEIEVDVCHFTLISEIPMNLLYSFRGYKEDDTLPLTHLLVRSSSTSTQTSGLH